MTTTSTTSTTSTTVSTRETLSLEVIADDFLQCKQRNLITRSDNQTKQQSEIIVIFILELILLLKIAH